VGGCDEESWRSLLPKSSWVFLRFGMIARACNSLRNKLQIKGHFLFGKDGVVVRASFLGRVIIYHSCLGFLFE
jgi:hypothetical protein